MRHLGAMIGLPLGYDRLDEPLTARQLADAVPSPHDPRSARALQVAREGWTLSDHLGARDQYGLGPRLTEPAR